MSSYFMKTYFVQDNFPKAAPSPTPSVCQPSEHHIPYPE